MKIDRSSNYRRVFKQYLQKFSHKATSDKNWQLMVGILGIIRPLSGSFTVIVRLTLPRVDLTRLLGWNVAYSMEQ